METKIKLDYWMYDIVKEALESHCLKKCFLTTGKKIYHENTNRFNPLGQIRLIEQRIQDMKEEHDKLIKDSLKKREGSLK